MNRRDSTQARPAALPALTSLRFFAALAVVLDHSDQMVQSIWLKEAYRTFFMEGYSGVCFFFLLSGFVLAYGYAGRLRTLSLGKIWEFGTARFARIYPLHLIMLLLTILAYPIFLPSCQLPSGSDVPPAFIANLTLTQSFFANPTICFAYNGPSWSLSVEAFFYLTFPWTIWFLTRRVWGSRRMLFPALAVLLWLAQCKYERIVGLSGSPRTGWACQVLPFARWPEFAAGVLFGLWFSARRSIDVGAGSKWIWTVAETGCLAFLAACIYFRDDIPPFLHTKCAYAPAFSLLILISARQGGYLSSLLAWRPLVFLGEASFALYLVHITCISLWWKHLGIPLGSQRALGVLLCTIATLAVGCFFHVALERPARNLCLAALRGRPNPARTELAPIPMSRAA